MKEWILYALTALVLWGFWGFFPKIAEQYISPQSVLVFQILGNMIVGIIVLFSINFSLQIHSSGILFAILTGMAGLGGAMFFLLAIKRHSLAVVSVLTALYPIVTIALSYFFLNETITLKQLAGIIFALMAIVLFSY